MSEISNIPGGKFLNVVAHNPQSVCCDDALLATALLTVGVPEHPRISFASLVENEQTAWRWLFADKSACGKYETSQLIKWWQSPEWHAANASHEFALVARVLRNHAEVARRIRETPQTVVIRHGELEAHIPVNATPELRAHMIGKLEGRIPLNTKFTQPNP